MKRFCEYLQERRDHRRQLLEAVHVIERDNNQMLLTTFGEFLGQVRDPQHSYIKVLKYENDHFRTYNMRFENNDFFEFNIGNNNPAKMTYLDDSLDEATVHLVYNDYEAIADAADIGESQVILYHENGDEDFFIHYDDRLNIVFLCIGAREQQVLSYVNGLISSLQGMIDGSNEHTRVNGDRDHIQAAIQNYQGNELVLAFLTPMASQQEIQRNIEQQDQRQIQQIDVVDVDPEQVENAIDHNDQEAQEGNDAQQDQQQQEQPQQNAGDEHIFRRIHGIRFRLEDSNQLSDYINDREDLIVSGKSFEEFQQILNSLPQEALQVLRGNNQDRAVVYKQVQWDDAVDPLRRLSFMRFTKTGDIYKVIFSCKKNAHKFIESMDVDVNVVNNIVLNAPNVWARSFLRIWVRRYNAYEIELLWDPDNIGRTLKHVGNNPNAQGNAVQVQPQQQQQEQPERPQRRQRRAQDQDAERPVRQRQAAQRGNNEEQQLQQLNAQVADSLQQHEMTNADFVLITGNKGRKGGIPRDNNKYFVLKFPGFDDTVLVDQQAITFLSELDLWENGIKPAFELAKNQIEDLKLCITMNNRYYTPNN